MVSCRRTVNSSSFLSAVTGGRERGLFLRSPRRKAILTQSLLRSRWPSASLNSYPGSCAQSDLIDYPASRFTTLELWNGPGIHRHCDWFLPWLRRATCGAATSSSVGPAEMQTMLLDYVLMRDFRSRLVCLSFWALLRPERSSGARK